MKLEISKEKGVDISEGMIGLFFEDINYAADGGLYAECIENRAFEFLDARGDKGAYYQNYDGGYGWSAYPKEGNGAVMEYLSEGPCSVNNPHYLRFTGALGQLGFCNKAYDGICMKQGDEYQIAMDLRAVDFDGTIQILVEKEGKTGAETTFDLSKKQELHDGWNRYTGKLTAKESMRGADFIVRLSKPGTVEFSYISMMPEDAVLGIFRKDLAKALKALKPGFLRFPGGCVVEGNELSNRYQWKKSVGDVTERKANWNRWAVHGNNKENEFVGKYNHYNQTLGLGYYEYFLLCEYLGAKALPVVNVGLACQYQSYELVEIGTPEFQEFIQDALDLIEFANGTPDTFWGSVRASMGHPEPFGLEMIGIGNEQWETEKVHFFERYELFEKAIHAKYPQMKLIGSAGPDVTSEHYSDAWEFYHKNENKKSFAYAVDEHYYVKPQWFLDNDHFYDDYSRKVKVFSGEYAAHPENVKDHTQANTWEGALSEAAFLTGVERNADVVVLASYAPLFARIGYTQWAPDLIWFDDEKSYMSPSYYVQQMYSLNLGDYTMKSTLDQKEDGVYQTVSYNEKEHEMIIKLVNASKEAKKIQIELPADVDQNQKVKVTMLSHEDVKAFNSLEQPTLVAPENLQLCAEDLNDLEMPASSFLVARCKVEL